jgi:hypothetical protein
MDTGSKIKIIVCYYNPWEIPKNDLFLPIQAGRAITNYKLKMLGDDTGDNISKKNAIYSEFTVWYWAYRNIRKLYPNLEYIGLSHYRRYFSLDYPHDQFSVIQLPRIPPMNGYGESFISALASNDIILAKPAFFEQNIKDHYAYWHHSSDYSCMKQIIHELCPEYDASFSYISENSQMLSLYCIFVAKYELFDRYFQWIFPLLFEAERRIDVRKYSDYQKRVLAFLAERLLNVYVYHHKLKVAYRPIYYIDSNGLTEITEAIGVKAKIKKIVKLCIPYGIVTLREFYSKNCKRVRT